jgi:hypothetical protein
MVREVFSLSDQADLENFKWRMPMSIISSESMKFLVVSGEHKGRICVIRGEQSSIQTIRQVIFDDSDRNTFVEVSTGTLAHIEPPGWPETSHERSYDLQEWFRQKGNGSNALRTPMLCQPRTLRKGDVLVTGEIVTESVRRGWNSGVLVHLDRSGWVELASRLPIALTGNNRFYLPIELDKGCKLATGCLVAEKPLSLEASWTVICLDNSGCQISIPSCIPLALASVE